MEFLPTLAAAQAGDRTAAANLLERWRPLLWLQAMRLLGRGPVGDSDAARLVDETLAYAAAHLAKFRGQQPKEWVAWLCRLLVQHVAERVPLDVVEKQGSRQRMLLEAAGAQLSPDVQMEHIERAGALAEALQRLPDSMQTAIVHRVFLNRSWDDVARVLGMTPAAAQLLWARAIKKLREELHRDP